jgi:hypothetical protein
MSTAASIAPWAEIVPGHGPVTVDILPVADIFTDPLA